LLSVRLCISLEKRDSTYFEHFDDFVRVYRASHPRRQYYSKSHLTNCFEELFSLTVLSTVATHHQLQALTTNKTIPTLQLFVLPRYVARPSSLSVEQCPLPDIICRQYLAARSYSLCAVHTELSKIYITQLFHGTEARQSLRFLINFTISRNPNIRCRVHRIPKEQVHTNRPHFQTSIFSLLSLF
jgi:hypothetical protein